VTGTGECFCLDCLVAARDDTALPSFDDYHPPMKAYYEQLRPE
jgi:hypothetical protein